MTELEAGQVDSREAAVDDAVLVDVPETVEVVQGLRPVRSVVRLRPLKDCPAVVRDVGHELVPGELRGVPHEGERDLVGNVLLPQLLDRIRAARDQPDRVLQGGPQRVDEVADQDAEGQRDGLSDAETHHVVSRIRLELSGDVIRLRLQKHLAAEVEGLQVFDRPLDLGPGSVEL